MMKEGFLGLFSLLAISIMVATLCHKKITNFILASVVSTIISVLIHQLVGILILGYLDPFFLIALRNGAAVAFVVALIVGIPFVFMRWKRQYNEDK